MGVEAVHEYLPQEASTVNINHVHAFMYCSFLRQIEEVHVTATLERTFIKQLEELIG